MKGVTVSEARERLPSASAFTPLVVATGVTFVSFLLTGIPELFESPERNIYQDVQLSEAAAYGLHALNVLSEPQTYAMFGAPLAILLLVNYRKVIHRALAGLTGGFLVGGIFGVFSELVDAVERAYIDPELTASAAYYATEAWGGFLNGGGTAVIIGGLFVMAPILSIARIVESAAGIRLFNRRPLDDAEVA